MKKTVFLFVLLLGFATAGAASGFGSFAYTSSKQIDGLEASFRLGVINLNDAAREVGLSSDAPDAVAVRFEQESFTLPPSTVSTDPAGEGWIHLGDGRYAEPFVVPFTTVINESYGVRNHSIPVTVTARASEELSGITRNVVQSRQYSFDLYSSSPALIQRADQETEEDTGLFGVDRMEDTGAVNASSREGSGGQAGADDAAEKEQKNITRDSQVPGEEERGGATTTVLVVAIVLTALYILYEAL